MERQQQQQQQQQQQLQQQPQQQQQQQGVSIDAPSARMGPRPCRYGLACYRPDCYFSHPPGRVIDPSAAPAPRGVGAGGQPGAAPTSPKQTACRYDTACLRPDCHFLHPNGRSVEKAGGNGVGGGQQQGGHKPQRTACRYGENCRMSHCKFYHKDRRNNPQGGFGGGAGGGFIGGGGRVGGYAGGAGGFGGGVNRPRVPSLAKQAYVAPELKQREARGFRAAGVLPYRKDADGKIHLLMGNEKRGYTEVLCLNFLGGARGKAEESPDTAVRQLNDMSGRILGEAALKNIADTLRSGKDRQLMWVPGAKYALFIYEAGDDLADLHTRFANRSREEAAPVQTEAAGSDAATQPTQPQQPQQQQASPVDSLVWIPLEGILESVSQRKDHILGDEGKKLNFYSFITTVFGDAAFKELTPFTEVATAIALKHAPATTTTTTTTSSSEAGADAAGEASGDASAPAAAAEAAAKPAETKAEDKPAAAAAEKQN